MKKVLLLTLFIIISNNYLSQVEAQNTFGPVCDDVTVTCVPTQSPTPGGPTETPTLTPSPSYTPTPPPPIPTELPRAGTTENVRNVLIIALFMILTGTLGTLAFSSRKS